MWAIMQVYLVYITDLLVTMYAGLQKDIWKESASHKVSHFSVLRSTVIKIVLQ